MSPFSMSQPYLAPLMQSPHVYMSQIQIEIQMCFFQVCARTGWMSWPPQLKRYLAAQSPTLLQPAFFSDLKVQIQMQIQIQMLM